MEQKFSGQFDAYLRQASLTLRQTASLSGIPHQTLFNWLKGAQPRWHAALPEYLQRLGAALNLAEDKVRLLQHLAVCVSARAGLFAMQEVPIQGLMRIPKG